MKSVHEFQAAFQQEYPEVGALNDGTYLGPEEAHQFASIISGKIVELSRKPELSEVEQSFIDRTMDLGARSALYMSDRYRASYPYDSEATKLVVDSANRLHPAEPTQGISEALNSVTGSAFSMRTDPSLRMPIEDAARGTMHMFSEMANASNGRIMLDNYLEGNLQNIVAHFELVEQQQQS